MNADRRAFIEHVLDKRTPIGVHLPCKHFLETEYLLDFFWRLPAREHSSFSWQQEAATCQKAQNHQKRYRFAHALALWKVHTHAAASDASDLQHPRAEVEGYRLGVSF